jgi:hypothetical protein
MNHTVKTIASLVDDSPDDLHLRQLYAEHLAESGVCDEELIVARLAGEMQCDRDTRAICKVLAINEARFFDVEVGDERKRLIDLIPNRVRYDPYLGRVTAERSLWAARVLDFVQENMPAIRKKEEQLRRHTLWLEAADAGDHKALLANPITRSLVTKLAQGERQGRGQTITSHVRNRKAIREAKAFMLARLARINDRAVAERARNAGPNRVRRQYITRLRQLAVATGLRYHRTTRALYRSKHATVVYGRGGEEEVDWQTYSKTYHSRYGPARWCNAGARLDNEERPTAVLLENWRGTEVARIPITEARNA